MNYYIELTVIDSPELTAYQIWSKLYTQLHLAFVEQQDDDGEISYGVGFPQYRINADKQIGFLGFRVRIFAPTEQALQDLNLAKWLERLTDYVHMTSIRAVPQDRVTGHACYYRTAPKIPLRHRILHQAKRRGISVEEVRAYFQDYQETKTAEPFVQLNSLTNGHSFRLYIGKTVKMQPQSGSFSVYGLSRETTVPEFA
ncbi:type I-F CRISPR-associated endoribonuclease Cas6/Csy4 [Moraxella cuniculi]|uniref:CRISPR-associated protein Cas6/Csy4, subtype I-F/YPEST n=1 Tax=Moraxella cuniculi TaxID=34061 RepID=A0A448GUU1_9GAMM|nr:type I-F CRISPR-associated endoribonuclease Cas6/Csy4 [Moraxella cuniculi]VEG12546.1 CRISPR-associated protein Cas6/Csy4, subtype I-F/YPEST [Moraxella cuniculi]